jgi:hypothetical protein
MIAASAGSVIVIPGRAKGASPESITTVSEYEFRTRRQSGDPE